MDDEDYDNEGYDNEVYDYEEYDHEVYDHEDCQDERIEQMWNDSGYHMSEEEQQQGLQNEEYNYYHQVKPSENHSDPYNYQMVALLFGVAIAVAVILCFVFLS